MSKEKIGYVVEVSNALTKKGKISKKGKNKKKLHTMCCHAVYSKKGKIKSKIINNNDGTCTCTICGATFAGKLYTKNEVQEILKPTVELLQATKYTSVAAGVNNDGIKYVVGTLSALKKFPKYYRNVRKVVAKTDEKTKKPSYDVDSTSFGSWAER